MSDPVQPQRRQPTSIPRLWDSPGKNTGVGCRFLLQCMKVKSESEVAQSCPTLRDPMDHSLPDSSVHGIYQARVLEWVYTLLLIKSLPLKHCYKTHNQKLLHWGTVFESTSFLCPSLPGGAVKPCFSTSCDSLSL